MKHVTRTIIKAAAGAALLACWSGSAAAEGLASQGKSLGGLSDRQCVRKVDRVVANERGSPTYVRTVRSEFSRRLFYEDGSVDFACFPNQVVITVYFVNAGGHRARKDLRNFLSAF